MLQAPPADPFDSRLVFRRTALLPIGMLVSAVILLSLVAGIVQSASADALTVQQQLAKDIFKELIEINTVSETGDTGRAAEAMAARLRAAGFGGRDVAVFKPAPRKGNLVVRLRGTGALGPSALNGDLLPHDVGREQPRAIARAACRQDRHPGSTSR